MQPSKQATITPVDTGSTAHNDSLTPAVTQTAALTQYIEDHKLPGHAANDPHRLALADFLFEHMKQRANAEPD